MNLYEFIIGDVVALKEDYVVLQNNGIGYRIYTSTNSIANIEIGKKSVVMYTYFNVREDGVYLYGFTSEEEMSMFKLLLLVSKIGPKIGLGILSTLTPNQIKLGIMNNDSDVLCKAPGIGKKTASRIILELKDRIDTNVEMELDLEEIKGNDYDEAINGLMFLGYSRNEIDKVLRKIDTSKMSTEDIIREVLKKLSKH
nr:Holliday junction branch migration protein RuvA [Tissierella simiarum]